MFFDVSSQKFKNMHFASCPAEGGKGDPIGLAALRFGGFGLQERGQLSGREAQAARPCEPSSRNTALANSLTASSVASGASRCGEWPAPKTSVTSTGQ